MKKMITIQMKDGNSVDVEHTILSTDWAYRKDGSDYWLTHIPSGRCFGSFKKVKTIKELLLEDCFFNDKYTDFSQDAPESWYEIKMKYYTKKE